MRVGGGAVLLVVLALRLGVGPFVDGVRRVDSASLVAATGITAVTTALAAWRWRLIAAGLGLRIDLRDAVSSYYRSQFLNSTLPGGVLGDVHRGLRLGADADDVSRALRSVAWDRAAGQFVQVAMATATLLVLSSPVRPDAGTVFGVGATAAALTAVTVRFVRRDPPPWAARLVRRVRDDLRAGPLSRRAAPGVLVASTLVVAGHAGVFLVAARTQEPSIHLTVLLPLAMLVLLSMSVPLSVGGWGPREGVAAWAFAAAGLGAARGVETATTYGVLSLVAILPGAVVLVVARRPRLPAAAPTSGASLGRVNAGVSAATTNDQASSI